VKELWMALRYQTLPVKANYLGLHIYSA